MNSSDVVAVLLDASMPPDACGRVATGGPEAPWLSAQAGRGDGADLDLRPEGIRAGFRARFRPTRARAWPTATATTSPRSRRCASRPRSANRSSSSPTSNDRSNTPRRDEILGLYAEIVSELRGAKPGDALALRAQDVATLAAALDSDSDTIERNIMDALGCSREEARALHADLLRRKIVLPIAGLAAGVAALAGMQVAQASNAPHPVAPTKIEASLEWAPAPAGTPAPTPKPKAVTKRVVKKATPPKAATPPPAPKAATPPSGPQLNERDPRRAEARNRGPHARAGFRACDRARAVDDAAVDSRGRHAGRRAARRNADSSRAVTPAAVTTSGCAQMPRLFADERAHTRLRHRHAHPRMAPARPGKAHRRPIGRVPVGVPDVELREQ